MKPTVQPSKSMATGSTTTKSKKNLKEKEKRKSQGGLTDSSSSEKGSPTKDSKQYAGISSESICIYAEQSTYEHLSRDVCNLLTEDINYKLRYIIHDALVKARLSGRDAINSKDIDETFKNLSIEKVYGATSDPNWIPLGDENILYLDDGEIDLFQLAEDEETYVQPGDVILKKTWFPDPELSEPSTILKNYFTTICKSVVSNDEDLRRMALKDISENPQIGPIIEWFYHFGYFLLMKDITYDCLTLSALQLIETLENSPLGSANVSEKQLKLLVRLLLQRLLLSTPTKEVLKTMCSVLAILCLREPLKEMAIIKINKNVHIQEKVFPILNAIYFLGVDAVNKVFLSNLEYFMERILSIWEQEPDLLNIVLGICSLISKSGYNYYFIYSTFYPIFGSLVFMFWKPAVYAPQDLELNKMDFVHMKTQLIKTRRKVDRNIKKSQVKLCLEEIFEIPIHNCKVQRKIEEHRMNFRQLKKETHITVGRTSLLLSVLKNKKIKAPVNFCHHSLLSYQF